ncbi:GNAT family N-acetyltransferase [Falsihalocynthiibacter sp. S25ZX9]|uniref:GNAT family N-acetyltransferase n=1 Tax=Falsihalocynthiibacter sp. S25ZX9 TaxID=3240870 RepID=UPI00350FC5D3
MTPFLRRYRDFDSPACYEIFCRAVHVGAAQYYSEPQRNAWAPHTKMPESWPLELAEQACWVASVEQKLVGFFSLESDGHLSLAYVAPEFRRTAVAAELYKKITEDAQRLVLARLFTEASHLARPFFEKRGWHITAPEVVMRNGVEIERFQMAKDLK